MNPTDADARGPEEHGPGGIHWANYWGNYNPWRNWNNWNNWHNFNQWSNF